MKYPFASILPLSALTMSCLAAETNPFLSSGAKNSTPESPTGDSFITLTEHILVPADKLDAWLEIHPLTGDASALRAEVQAWITAGTARLDQTAVSTGTTGKLFINDSIREQFYATEYEPPDNPGEWPHPTAFDQRNLGYNVRGGAGIEQGAAVLHGQMEYAGMMLPHHAFSPLVEVTREPGDVFIPRFRVIKAERSGQDAVAPGAGEDPFAEPANTDPFAPRPDKSPSSKELRFDPGQTYLASRTDQELPEPLVGAKLDLKARPAKLPATPLVRLIFFRGELLAPDLAPPTDTKLIRHLSSKLIRVPHKDLSAWLQATPLSKVPDLAWSTAMGWEKNGAAETLSSLTGTYQSGSASVLENIVEVTYPTEWEIGQRQPARDGKPAYLDFSNPTGFETRNVGTTMQAAAVPDPKGALLKFELTRSAEGGKSVHNRILRDGEWKVDVTFPIFVSNTWNSELRIKTGVWLLVGSGSDIDGKGDLDPANSVLAFIKLD